MSRVIALLALAACSKGGDPSGSPSGSTAGLATGTPSHGCPVPPLAASRGGDASADARAGDPWFLEITANGLSDDVTTSGVAWADLDRDGDPDALLSRDDTLAFYRNDGCFELTRVPLDAGGAVGRRLAGAMATDLDRDGLLDLYVPGSGGDGASLLLMSDGAWDRFVDRAAELGVDNPGAYVRGGASIGDVDGDGWLDLAVGGHQIGGGVLQGRPLSRLFRFVPGPGGFADGAFVDHGAALGGFGDIDPATCAPGSEWTGLDATLADVDGDGHLDLLHATHVDMFDTKHDDPCATGEAPYGLRLWRGDGAGGFTEQPEGGVVDLGRMAWNDTLGHYEIGAEGPGLGAETLLLFDPDNDGDRDLLAVGPTDPEWAISSGMVQPGQPGSLVRFLRNDGGTFTEATSDAGLDVLDRTLGQWGAFFGHPVPATSSVMDSVCGLGPQEPLCTGLAPADRQPYPGHALALDADNDGWVDLLFVNRQCSYNPGPDDDFRSVLLRNRGDGSYEPLTTELSGVVGCGLAAFAVDVDRDGWVDLHLISRDQLQQIGDLRDRVLWNVGAQRDHRDRHWMRIALDGPEEARLLGARLIARDGSGAIVATGWVERESWRGSVEPEVHLGLGAATSVTVEVTLRDGTTASFTPAIDAGSVLSL